ncbi:lysophospholipid acyltransferase family protein [Spiroplasma endosymbiont of Amphibalanus improvisus]|uniref:lysophospholipid acyltransferase family protein n=1 Tax=Spiroplasma endosymbiont of Amphibalanus improvisus TaxID=3066327 RepID=UPI00313E2F8A
MLYFKILITLPYFLNMFRKSRSMTKKILRNPNSVEEEKRYIWIHRINRYFLWLQGIKIVPHDYQNWIDKKCLIVANHQSNYDPSVLLRLNDFKRVAPIAFIAKKELKTARIFKNFVQLIDVIFLDRENPRQAVEVLNKASNLIRIPRAMVLFPEGTRSKSYEVGEFKGSFLKIAQKANAPIIPVSIVNSFKARKKKYVHIIFHKPLKPSSFLTKNTEVLSKQLKETIVAGIEENKNITRKQSKKLYKQHKKRLKGKNKQATDVGMDLKI